MTLDKIIRESEIVSRAKGGNRATEKYTVRITVSENNKTARIYFDGRAKEIFKGSKVVPIVHNTANVKRVYFAKENQINASDALRNPGYSLNETPKSATIGFSMMNRADTFKDFAGSYSDIHLDADCMLYFIERPTRF